MNDVYLNFETLIENTSLFVGQESPTHEEREEGILNSWNELKNSINAEYYEERRIRDLEIKKAEARISPYQRYDRR